MPSQSRDRDLEGVERVERLRRLGIARGQYVAPDAIDGASPLIAHLFEQG